MNFSDNARGILFMCGSMLAFTVNDSFMKAASQTLPLFQAIALRGMLASVALVVIARVTMGHLRLVPLGKDAPKVVLRSISEIAATATFLIALTNMPLANLSAILQSLPLAITLGAAVFLKEPVGWRRLLAILIGFCGVLLIVKPGTEGFTVWSVLGLISVACVVVRDLTTRTLSRGTPSAAVAVWASVAVMTMGVAITTWHGWVAVSAQEALYLAIASAALICGYMFAVMVMRVGDIGLIAPFRYTSLLWAILFGWLLFGALPDNITLIGSAIVVATGLYSLLRERMLSRRRAG
ncbi:DMT family transporter [Fuscibacter oryzae]|uniref:DMT family transporter n=1 Tax=Fuscibacter oryzae TaxID=2803939 RepID=A0A8J7STC8_9RHOB|nr:DMT family transporter [Fuscibacter oryzae]MBL4928400.1 DMT family transporter [Fuscibacter oryzae]